MPSARPAPIRALREEAASDATSAKRLRELAEHPSKSVRLEVAGNPKTPWRALVALAGDSDELVRLHATSTAMYVPAAELLLAKSPDKWVRAVLAHAYARRAGALKRSVQILLSKDEFKETRYRIAETTDQLDLFECFLAGTDLGVRAHCALNPRITREQMERLVTDESAGVRATAAMGGCLFPDEDQLGRLARDPSGAVQAWLINRADAPIELVALVAAEGHPKVRARAADILEEPERYRSAENLAYRDSERARARPGEFKRPS